MKGLILSGGKGTRLRPLTYTSAKQLVPVANKPVLFYTIEDLVAAGITDIGIVVGTTAPEIRAAVGTGARWNAHVTYLDQPDPLGLAHAVVVAEEFIGGEPFVMYLGDNMLEDRVAPFVQEVRDSQWDAQVLLKRVRKPEAYGVAELSDDGRVKRLVEKPREFVSDLALVGIYMFNHHIFEAVHNIKPSWRNELEITDAIQYLLDHGHHVHPRVLDGWWIDTGKLEDMLEVNHLVLDKLAPSIEGFVDADSQIKGKVVIEHGAEIINSNVRGPAIIGKGTRIVNSYIGPYTAINYGCTITNSEIEHSIILENSQIIDLPGRLEDSLIGRNVEISRSPIKPKAYKMLLGDNSNVGVL
ncbi:MAG TPA: glucose-1-phosphate thymidylyltransferase [Chloroflexia bacterium]|nr:glucose-1-phosphate thymidylyltransferase [Chloroflexia bacterium]